MSLSAGKSIKLFLVEGAPRGVTVAEIGNWIGQVIFAPRMRLAEALKRPEANKPGVYFLCGDDPDQPSKPMVYIGQSDGVAGRLKKHNAEQTKEFWTETCIVTAKDNSLTPAHARYLESRLLRIAKDANRANVSNYNDAFIKGLPEADISDMEFFLEQIRIILPVLGFEFLRPRPEISAPGVSKSAPSTDSLELVLLRDQEIIANAIEQDGEITVLNGSKALVEKFTFNYYEGLRKQLITEGRISNMQTHLLFNDDITFKSPSAAASVILNRNANGRTEWKLKDTGQTLKEYQDAKLAALS
jgi:hypothetical protein